MTLRSRAMEHFNPFRYFVKNGEAFCPKCARRIGYDSNQSRKVCPGGFFKSCPKVEHFHMGCSDCGGKWMEATYEAEGRESEITLKLVLESLLRRNPDLSEEKLLLLWREAQVRGVHES